MIISQENKNSEKLRIGSSSRGRGNVRQKAFWGLLENVVWAHVAFFLPTDIQAAPQVRFSNPKSSFSPHQ